ncbi:MAG: alpha-2-macroglobulin [Planctomycetaceae bacterium]|nr:alpha-2-macroglobulin [Planctomycetaceae bacterium]
MFRFSRLWIPGLLLAVAGGAQVLFSAEPTPRGLLTQAKTMYDDGNYAEALDAYRRLTTDPDSALSGKELVDAFGQAVACFGHLNQIENLDEYREAVAAAHPDSWRVQLAVGQSYGNQVHYGFLVAGEFHRGNHRGGGKVVHASARDRVRAMQLYRRAYELAFGATGSEPGAEAQAIFDRMAEALQMQAGGAAAWRLQKLTDLTELPDYEDGWGNGGQAEGAAVDPQGEPIVYDEPESWDAAANDGERWRWVLAERTRQYPATALRELLDRAAFLQSQFGVETLARFGWPMGRSGDDDADKTGTFALHTLGEDETIARLATGVKRFPLPAGHSHLELLKQVAADAQVGSWEWREANERLARLFENRRQYPRAVEFWQTVAAGADGHVKENAERRIRQITGAWGRLEPAEMQPAGRGATLAYRFRNGKQVEFVARAIDVRKLLDDLKKYLTSNPRELSWEQLQIDNLGYRLVTKDQQQYVGAEAARWTLPLEPRSNHFDRRVTIAAPLTKPGAYLVTARMADGNKHHVVLWVTDTAIVKKPLESAALYYVADAVTGRPVERANVEFFGWRREQRESGRYVIDTTNVAELTDAAGMAQLPSNDANRRMQWLAIATTPDGRLAHLGFSHVWSGQYYEQQYRQVKAYALTDRPVYRPGDEVQFKFWVRSAQYDADQSSDAEFAAKSFVVEIRDPRNEKVFSQTLTSDKYGGIAGTWKLPPGATLGQYQLFVVNHGGGSFRVEEYKKPEFEVTIDAPDEPLMLGEQATATISAKYYFGSPVVNARVKYKVLRSEHNAAWYPPMPWDWLYGPGYWWFAETYDWYPGWSRWGCGRPWPWWWWRQPAPPEVIAEQEVEIGPDGTVEISIDTLPAKELHGDQDHRYEITAEVTDESRRTIAATGQVLVARQPFRVFLWTDRGYYRAGEPMQLEMAARTLDGNGVAGAGVLRLLSIEYVDGKPVETEVAKWELPADEQGRASLQIKASEPGQYRLAYEVTDKAGHRIEGGQVITVRGEGFDGGDFRFNDLEVIPDRREYAPGDTVKLQLNVDRRNATVLLFVRPSNGIYLKPQVVEVSGKSTVVDVPIEARDMPNFFVEAVAVHGGQLHTVAREIFVPPTKRVVDVEVAPTSDAYLPGQEATVSLKVTGPDGKPAVGSLVVAIYDKALDYIAGGAGAADIREFFWKWRREHRPQQETNLGRVEPPANANGETAMEDIGLFGNTSVDDLSVTRGDTYFRDSSLRRSMSARGGMMAETASMAMPAAPMAMADEGGVGGVMQSNERFAPGTDKADAGQPPAEVVPEIRENFADTALWVGALETDANGLAEVSLTMPENLTAWKINAWSMGSGTRVGEGSAEAVTRKNIIVRLQAPRFFVERDEVVLSANVHNYLDQAKQVRVKLDLEGGALSGPDMLEETIEVPAGGEYRVDWRVKAVSEGEAVVRVSALTDEESDAMQMRFPVLVHGMLKMDSFSGVLRPDDGSGGFTFTVPAQRRPEQTRLEVRYTPTLAGAMLDALPYLIDYPYGCTEQTLNRFLPAVLTQRTLQKMGVDLAALKDKTANLNAQEIGDPAERAAQWDRFEENPVFDEAKLADVVKAGVNRLTEMQMSDGGWGWFSGWGERSSPHTTAVVVRGLLVARQNDVALVPGVLERGLDWLERYQSEQLALLDAFDRQADQPREKDGRHKRRADNLDTYVQLLLTQSGRGNPRMRAYLYVDRTELAPYAMALFGLSLQAELNPTAAVGGVGNDANSRDGDALPDSLQNTFPATEPADMLAMVVRNLSQYVQQDEENQTAWLNLPGGYWWHWYGSEYEAHAAYLKLLAATDPDSEVASRMVKYLLNNRKHATYWNSTRDTALVVEAFADYLAATGEAKPDLQVEVWLDGERVKTVAISPANLFTFDGTLVVEGDVLAAGEHVVELRKTGQGPLYFNGYLTNFTLEDPIAATGLELKIDRKFYRLIREETDEAVAGSRGQVIEQRVEKYRRAPVANLDELTSGELVEIELIVDSKNDYEYVMLEDRKAAGFEPVEVRSGYNGNDMGAYVEYRDQKVALFVRSLMRGRHSVSYRLRAEVPGQFSALPATAAAMYAPELKANSDELKVRVVDRAE